MNFGIKRLYSYMLQRFLPLLAMTFFICLFIVLMQFLWKSIDDLVGKGLTIDVISELFFYAALTMVPTALPLAVLLASLMVFGNLGEKFELTAMKASGISLFKIMKPLTVFMVLLAIGAFFFQNNVLPVAQTKMWTLLFSVRQKTPEVEIPERSFYDQIPNMNLYVERKNPETGMLYDMILYDITQGLDNTRVILADSGRFNFTEDKTHLFLHLHNGEMFENVRDNSLGSGSARYLPFRRESFDDKQIYFVFDMNFNRVDEGGLRSQYIGQNVAQLRHSIDSIGRQVDSVGNIYARELVSAPYMGLRPTVHRLVDGEMVEVPRPQIHPAALPDVDSVFANPSASYAKSYISQALAKARRQKQEYHYRELMLSEQAKLMRRHDIEMQKRFTLSVACLIFFFIGAPLGAIIKKGGIGTPLVISVLLFIVYFIIDNAGYKSARDGKIEVWLGIWLSTFALLPLGIFFTYKAAGDSAVFNADAWRRFGDRLRGRRPKRSLAVKEVHMTDVDPDRARRMTADFASAIDAERARIKALAPWRRRFAGVDPVLQTEMNALVDYISNSDDAIAVSLLNRLPFVLRRRDLDAAADTARQIADRLGKNK